MQNQLSGEFFKTMAALVVAMGGFWLTVAGLLLILFFAFSFIWPAIKWAGIGFFYFLKIWTIALIVSAIVAACGWAYPLTRVMMLPVLIYTYMFELAAKL